MKYSIKVNEVRAKEGSNIKGFAKIQIWTKEVVDAVVEIVRRTDSEEGVYHYEIGRASCRERV